MLGTLGYVCLSLVSLARCHVEAVEWLPLSRIQNTKLVVFGLSIVAWTWVSESFHL